MRRWIAQGMPTLGVVHGLQARNDGTAYLALVPDFEAMAYWISRVCKDAREKAGRKDVHIAGDVLKPDGSYGVNAATISRFEKARAGRWPEDVDEVVRAYAKQTGREAIDLWAEALRLWREHRLHPITDVTDPPDPPADAASAKPARKGRPPRAA